LLDVGVVVFFVGSAAGELDAVLFAVPVEVVVDELRAVVRIDGLEWEGKRPAYRVQDIYDALLTLAHDAETLPPSAENVGEVKRVDELTRRVGARMRDQVNFAVPGLLYVPIIGLY